MIHQGPAVRSNFTMDARKRTAQDQLDNPATAR